MKKSILSILVILASVVTASAQKGGAAFFKTGYSYAPGASKVFSKIGSEGTPNFTNNYLIIGLELYYRTNRYIITWEGYSQEQPAYSIGDHSAIPFLGATHFKFGRVIKETKRSWLYPSIGVGASVIDLADYNRLKNQPDNSINQMLITPSFDAGINKDFLVGKADHNEKRFGGSIVGLRAGYRTSFRGNGWVDGDWRKLNNMPSYSNNSFYFSVTIGAGGFVRK